MIKRIYSIEGSIDISVDDYDDTLVTPCCGVRVVLHLFTKERNHSLRCICLILIEKV